MKLVPGEASAPTARAGPGGTDSIRQARRSENSLLSLFELSQEISASRDVFAIAELALLNAMGHFGTLRAAMWAFPEPPADEAATLRAFGFDSGNLGALGRALRRAGSEPAGRPEDPRLLWLPEEARRAGITIAISIESHGGTLGVLALGGRVSCEPYGELEIEFLRATSRMLGTALDSARLYQNMAESNRLLRRAYDDLKESDRLKTEFVSNVNHEMRTPLSVLLGFLQLLAAHPNPGEPVRRAVEAMTTQANRLDQMVRDLLEYSSLSDGTARVHCDALDVKSLLERYAAERRPGVLAGLRTFETEVSPDLPEALGEPRRIERALDALVDNAVKFTPAGTRIVLRARSIRRGGHGWISIEVADDGPGIAPELLPQLFEPFRQGDGSLTRKAGGIGLGLALVRELAECMKGQIEAESTPPHGATFRLMLRSV